MRKVWTGVGQRVLVSEGRRAVFGCREGWNVVTASGDRGVGVVDGEVICGGLGADFGLGDRPRQHVVSGQAGGAPAAGFKGFAGEQ